MTVHALEERELQSVTQELQAILHMHVEQKGINVSR